MSALLFWLVACRDPSKDSPYSVTDTATDTAPDTAPDTGDSDTGDSDSGGSDTGDSDSGGSDTELSLLFQDIDGDYADSARAGVWSAGTLYVVGQGIYEGDGTEDGMAWSAYARAYDDTTGALIDQDQIVGDLRPGEKSWLMAAAIADDGGEDRLFAIGRSNLSGAADPCGYDAVTPGGDFDAYIFSYTLSTLEIGDCAAFSTPAFDEATGLDAGDGALWVGGSTQGAMENGGAPRGNNDVYVAVLRPDLDTAPRIAQIGTSAFDEVLGLDYDPDDDMLYVSGSTQGDLCAEWDTLQLDCTAGGDGEFDAYVAGFYWDTSQNELSLRFVYQVGRPGEDAGQDVVAFHDDAGEIGEVGGRYLYLTGRAPTEAPGERDQDIWLGRLRLTPSADGGMIPATAGGAVEVERWQFGGRGGDIGQNLQLSDGRIWLVGTTDGATDHAGACGGTWEPEDDAGGDGAYSHAVGALWGFSHADLSNPALAYDQAGQEDLGNRTVNFTDVVEGDGRLFALGNTSARFAPGAESFCGADDNNEADDEVDAVVFVTPR